MGNAATAQIRALQSKTILGQVEREFSDEQQAELRRRVGEDALHRMKSSLALSWLPMHVHMQVSDEILALSGPEPFSLLYQRAFERSVGGPLLGGLLGSVGRLARGSLHTVLRNGPRVYGHLVRNAGSVWYEQTNEHEARLGVRDWPTEFSTHCWALGTQGCVRAFLRACDPHSANPPTAEIVDIDERGGSFEYRVRWRL